jgi:hypothetical protein
MRWDAAGRSRACARAGCDLQDERPGTAWSKVSANAAQPKQTALVRCLGTASSRRQRAELGSETLLQLNQPVQKIAAGCCQLGSQLTAVNKNVNG